MEYGDISLNGNEYRILAETYNAKDIIDFSPRASVPGGSAIMSDLGLYQPLVQTDWRHGFGFHWYSDAAGYLSTSGNIDTRQNGLVMLMTKAISSDTDNSRKDGLTIFNGNVYSWGVSGLRKFNGTVWSSVYSTAAVNFALNAGDYLFFCPDGLRIQKMDSAGTITNAGLDANSIDYKWLIIHNGFIYAAKDGSNRIHYDDTADLSTLEGTTSDPDVIYAGITNVATVTSIVFNANLYVGKPDGLWMIGEDNIARRVLDFSNEYNTGNFNSMVVANGQLVFPIRDQIYQWNGARIANITPSRITDEYPYVTYGSFANFVAMDDFVYCTGKTNESNYSIDLLCWDGTGWHKLMNLVSNGTDSISMMQFDVVNNYLWYHLNATADATYYIRMQNNSPFPYPNFPTTGTHSVISSRLDMGYRRVIKSMNSIFIEARNVSSTRYLAVYYSLDGGDWVLWDNVTQNGVIELDFPGSMRSREFNYALIRIDFVTDSFDQSPILESWALTFIMRPDTKMGYTFDIVAASELMQDMLQDGRTSQDIINEIRDMRNSKAPIEFVDLMGNTTVGYISAIRERPVFVANKTEDGDILMEYNINVNFVGVE